MPSAAKGAKAKTNRDKRAKAPKPPPVAAQPARPARPARPAQPATEASKEVKEIFHRLIDADRALPARDNSVWHNPKEASKTLQREMAKLYKTDFEKDEEASLPPETKRGGIDIWQEAAALPLLRRRELLVIAPTGSGKSYVAANAIALIACNAKNGFSLIPNAPQIRRVIVAVRDGTARLDQLAKIGGSSVFREALKQFGAESVHGRKSTRLISVESISDTKPVSIISFAQAGYFFKKASKNEMRSTALLVDEVHELADPKDAAGAHAGGVKQLNEALDARARLPYDDRFVLLAMTATPPLDDPPGMEKILSWFAPPGVSAFSASELLKSQESSQATPLPPPSDTTLKKCDVHTSNLKASVPLTRFEGYSVFVYSAEKNTNRFASWTTEPLALLVPIDNTVAVEARKTGWTTTALRHHIRAKKIGAAYAEAASKVLNEEVKKSMVFLPTNSHVSAFASSIRKLCPAYKVTTLESDSKANHVESVKESFDSGGDGTLIVANAQTYGTGHTFQSSDSSKHVGLGARRIIYTAAKSAGKLVQVEGRANRRGTHAGLTPGERTIDRIILVPVGRGGIPGKIAKAVVKAEAYAKNGKLYDVATGSWVDMESEEGRYLATITQARLEYEQKMGFDSYDADPIVSEELRRAEEDVNREIEFEEKHGKLPWRAVKSVFTGSPLHARLPESRLHSALSAAADTVVRKLGRVGVVQTTSDSLTAAINNEALNTCELTQLTQNIVNRWSGDSVYNALFNCSFARDTFWRFRPNALDGESGGSWW